MYLNKYNQVIKLSAVGLLALTLGGTLAACGNKATNSSSDTQSSKTVQLNERVNDNGSFIVGKDGVLNVKADTSKKAILDIYLDPICPSCGNFDRAASKYLTEQVNSGKLLIRYHPLMFLDADSSDEYSTRASSFMLAVAEYAPNLAQKFVSAMYDKNFQPDEAAYKATSNDKIMKLFMSIGGTEKQATKIKASLKNFGNMTYETTMAVSKDKDLIKKSPTGQLFTPFILPNKPGKTADKALLLPTDPMPQLKKAIEGIEK